MTYLVVLVILTFTVYVASDHHEPSSCSCPLAQSITKDDDDLSTLQSVFILMRHGIRAPWTTYPLDPNVNNTAARFPNGGSQLTDAGIEQAYNVGKFYRGRYKRFIKDKKKQIFLRSSAAQRCIDTISIVSKTLWPPQEDEMKSWSPMIFSLPKQIDGILYEEPDCHSADSEEENNLKTPEVAEYEKNPKIQALYQFVANKTGLSANMYSVTKAFDCVRCEKLNGLDSPAWATPDIYEQMGDVLSNRLNFFYTSKKAQRLRAGPILRDLKTNMDAVVNAKPGDKPNKVFIYGSHDFKIASVLSAIGEPQAKYPAFAAAMIFELHKIGDKNIVRALYLNQTVDLPYTAAKLQLPNCKKAGSSAESGVQGDQGTPFLPKLTDMIGAPKLSLPNLSKIADTIKLPHIPKFPGLTRDKAEKEDECTYENFITSVADMTAVDWKSECGIDCSYDPFKVAEANLGKT